MRTINVAVAVITNREGKVLLTQRFDPDSPLTHMKWQLPGGGVEKNEDVIDTCYREIMEETGLNIKIVDENPKILSHSYESIKYKIFGFKAEIISGTINIEADEETHDAKWFEIWEIEKDFCLDDTIEMIEACLN